MKSCLSIASSMIFALAPLTNVVSAAPPVAGARCNISCTVDEIAEWSNDNSPVINLPHLARNKLPVSSTSLVLHTNGEVKITADNSSVIQLSKNKLHKLITEYERGYDTYNIIKTNSTVPRSPRNSLLKIAPMKTQVSGDDAVEIILSVGESKNTSRAGDSAMYTAAHTLTVCWKS